MTIEVDDQITTVIDTTEDNTQREEGARVSALPSFSWCVKCNPGLAAINKAKRPTIVTKNGKRIPGNRPSTEAKRFKALAREALILAKAHDPAGWELAGMLSTVRVAVTAYWPRQRRLADVDDLALGDVDAPIKAVLDAMEREGLLDDDVRVVELLARKFHSKADPRIEVEVWAVEP